MIEKEHILLLSSAVEGMMSKLCFSFFDNQGIELYHKGDGYGATLDSAPSCLGSHLRQIALSDVLLLEKEVCFLESDACSGPRKTHETARMVMRADK